MTDPRSSPVQPWTALLALLAVGAMLLAASAPVAALDDPGVDVENTTETATDDATSTVEDTTDTVSGTADDTTETVAETTDGTDTSTDGATDTISSTTVDGTSVVTETTETLDSTVDGVVGTAEGTLTGTTSELTGELAVTPEIGDDSLTESAGHDTEPVATLSDGSVESRSIEPRPARPAPDPAPRDASDRLPPIAAGLVVGGVAAQRALGLASGPGRSGLRAGYRWGRTAARRRLARWRRWARRLAGLAGYQRYDDSDPLEHEGRARLHDAIEAAGGAYPAELSRETDIPLSTVRYHLKVLAQEGLVESAEIRGKRRYGPAGEGPSALEAAIEDDGPAALLRALAAEGPATVSDLADSLDRDASTVTHHLQRLADDGLVERERDGRAVLNRLAPPAREALTGTPDPTEAPADD